jgi:glycosyltransferase involved in cell wall biosynthesis
MNKAYVVVSSPIDTISGYGARSRDFVRSLIKVKGDEWDIRLLSQRWGDCPFGALNPEVEEDKDLLDRIIIDGRMERQPDVWFQITVANEFQPIGKVNIGVSALVETTILPSDLMEGMNRMDFSIVSSNFVKSTAQQTSFDRLDQNTGQKQGELRLEKKVQVLFEGVDVSKYRKIDKDSIDLSEIKEEFCYLSVGHWLSGDVGEDRKQLTTLVKAFLNVFKDKKKRPALILKTSLAGFSIIEEDQIITKIDEIRKSVGGDLPNIYLMYGELTEEEMNSLYNHSKVKAFALVGNEGFGRPYLEFSAASSKPIIASPFSGHVDFLNEEFNIFVQGSVDSVHPSAANQFLLKESHWFKANQKSVETTLKEVYENYNKYVDMGKRQGHLSRTQFSRDKMTEKLKEILDANVPKISIPQTITLPKLKNLNA